MLVCVNYWKHFLRVLLNHNFLYPLHIAAFASAQTDLAVQIGSEVSSFRINLRIHPWGASVTMPEAIILNKLRTHILRKGKFYIGREVTWQAVSPLDTQVLPQDQTFLRPFDINMIFFVWWTFGFLVAWMALFTYWQQYSSSAIQQTFTWASIGLSNESSRRLPARDVVASGGIGNWQFHRLWRNLVAPIIIRPTAGQAREKPSYIEAACKGLRRVKCSFQSPWYCIQEQYAAKLPSFSWSVSSIKTWYWSWCRRKPGSPPPPIFCLSLTASNPPAPCCLPSDILPLTLCVLPLALPRCC